MREICTWKMVFRCLFYTVQIHIYFAFWLCACAFSTLTTIFCSSIRKALLILKHNSQCESCAYTKYTEIYYSKNPNNPLFNHFTNYKIMQSFHSITCLVHTWRTWNHHKLCWHASWFLTASWGPEVSQHESVQQQT